MGTERSALPRISRLLCYGTWIAPGIMLIFSSVQPAKNSAMRPCDSISSRVESVAQSLESAQYVTAILVFDNQRPEEVLIKRYRIIWSGGSFVGIPSKLVIPARESVRWKVRINPSYGDLRSLLNNVSNVTVKIEECKVKS